jgi:hypothetical protein
MSEPRSIRIRIFAWLCAAAIVLAGGYATFALRRTAATSDSRPAARVLDTPPERPYLMVRSTAPDTTWRRLLLVPLSTPGGPGYATPLACDRAYFAGTRGMCLVEEVDGLAMKHYADVFDERFVRIHRLPLTGLPSRTRVSPDGRRAAITVFESGHSYAEHGFSTRTTIVDTIAGRMLGDLEQFAIWRDGKRFTAVDFNFWGVTFAKDSNRFFATLATGGIKYLIEGDVDARSATVVRTGVECPSLSPDNTRIAYKHMKGQAGEWELHVLDLASGTERALSVETRSVDDQVDWLDNDRVMYHITGARGADMWVLRTDNSEAPRMLRPYAYSPAVVR